MARIRTIKPTFFRSQDMADLPFSARLTYIGLWTYVDDEARGIDDARLVKGDLWPLDEKYTVKKVEADLVLLAERGHIERYKVDGRHYLRVVEWHHQRINRPTLSTLPQSLSESSVSDPGAVTEDSPPEGKGRDKEEEQGRERAHVESLPPPAPPLNGRLSEPKGFVEIVDPGGPVVVRRETSAILDAVDRQADQRLLPDERRKLRPVVADALKAEYDPQDLVDAIVASPFRTGPAVMGELRKRKQPVRKSVGDSSLAAAASWVDRQEGA